MKRLYLEPSSVCNLNCSMCFRNNWIDETQGIMSEAVINKVYDYIADASDLESVMLAGMGEPLLHTRITQIVKGISRCGKKAELLTNATLLDEKMCNELIKAGLDILWVSLDKSHMESADKASKSIIKNIKYFNYVKKDSCRLGLTFVSSDLDVEWIYSFSRELCYDKINISGMIPEGPTDKIYSLNDILCEDRRKWRNYCPFIEEEKCFIKWNGDVCPCMPLLHSSYTYFYDEKRKVNGYSFGNVLNKDIKDIWNSPEYNRFREKVKNFEFPDCTLCDGCDDRKENMTDCMFNDMPTCGACLWAQNIARCP